jgi:hypothetical protein
MFMKRFTLFVIFAVAVVVAVPSFGAALGSNARTVIPSQVQQIISVDYRALKNSETGLALKAKVMPENLKQFEMALKGMQIDPDKDVEQLAFVSYRNNKNQLRAFGLAQGDFQPKKFYARMKAKKVLPAKYRDSLVYSTGSGMVMTFLDDSTMLFGEVGAVHDALDTRNGEAESVSSNPQINDMMSSVESGSIWSVLDQVGTQNMMRSALGDASKLADYDTVKKRLLGSHYTMDLSSGVNFNLDVLTSDTFTAATMSSLIQAGMQIKKMNATPVEKAAIDAMSVDSNSGKLAIHFKADDRKFQSFLQSDLFNTVAR